MSGLEQPNTSYVIISSENMDALTSVLWAKDYQILPIKCYYEGSFDDSVMAFKSVENDELRFDVLMLLDEHSQDSAIVKYIGDGEAKKIHRTGEERSLGLVMFNTDGKNKSYIHEGISFSFVEKARYWCPRKCTDIKEGMVVEYLNNNKWCKRVVRDPNTEWERMYSLLCKYEKLRIEMV